MSNKISFQEIIFGIITIGMMLFLALSFEPKERVIHEYYQVYLGAEKIGLLKNKDELYDLIDKEQEVIKKEYIVDKIYPPSGLEIQKVLTYSDNLMTAREVYEEIKDLDPFTIEGYEVNVKKGSYNKKFYILKKEDLDEAIKKTILAFVSEDDYNDYLNNTQKTNMDEGTEITDIYFDQNVTIKKAYISTEDEIITSADELSIYFLFGTTNLTHTYTVKATDTIEEIAYKNKLGVSDFLVANPKIVSKNALLAVGQEVIVAPINPVANIMVESYQVENQTISYDTDVEYDKSLDASEAYVKQKGVNGLSKVTYATVESNGAIVKTQFVSEDVITSPVNKVVVLGAKSIVYVGNSTYWAWPTSKPYRISSSYGYRTNPIYGGEQFHRGVDITGTPNRNIYAVQSGTVIASAYNSSMGNYIKIDHHNGYVTTYMHHSKNLAKKGDTVEKGELIAIMGSTGDSTGRHLDFRVQKDGEYMNPLSIYK